MMVENSDFLCRSQIVLVIKLHTNANVSANLKNDDCDSQHLDILRVLSVNLVTHMKSQTGN